MTDPGDWIPLRPWLLSSVQNPHLTSTAPFYWRRVSGGGRARRVPTRPRRAVLFRRAPGSRVELASVIFSRKDIDDRNAGPHRRRPVPGRPSAILPGVRRPARTGQAVEPAHRQGRLAAGAPDGGHARQ